MPTTNELKRFGRSDLESAIQKHGGQQSVAERLGLNYTQKRRGHWDDFSSVRRELLGYIEEHGTPGVMPTRNQLEKAGRGDIVNAMNKHGGSRAVAKQMGLETTYMANPLGYWDDFANVERELISFIEEHGAPGVMPTHEELAITAHGDLSSAIRKHGGIQSVAEQLGLAYKQKRWGYWDNFSIVERELHKFIQEHGSPGVMPMLKELKKAGQGDLASAIRKKHGGPQSVAERLKLTYIKKRKGYWEEFSNVEREIREFIREHGTSGVMPTNTELREAGRGDLVKGIHNYHGGFHFVARQLGLSYTGLERITAHTASSVERTARSIQPLAESNLLSGAQIMVILRRAGLLEYRNQRIVHLTASLARGDHEEIESAIAQLASSLQELETEAVTLEESEGITTAEIEALMSEELETGDRTYFAKSLLSSTTADTRREQAVIHGLSALGELRLPLDEVLSLLTSKILWEAFYRRLYAWYGSLDATQNVTGEDIRVSILSAYPEHATNDFVAEAATRFTTEVEKAVNFAASLLDFGWHGPRLRLHQADAARKMAEVLRGQFDHTFLLDADDPGMGKSISFLAAVCVSGIQNVLLVAPKTVADDTWTSPHGEILRCLPYARIVRGLDKTLTALRSSRLTFFVLHYEELLNEDALAALADHSFDCLCLDEIHFIKQRAGQEITRRRTALETLRTSARTAIGLTGTPLVNELSEPLSLLQTLSENSQQFDHSHLSNRRMADVADVFEAILPHIIRRRKHEVLLHLPGCDIRTVDISLPQDIEEQVIDIYGWPKARATQALVELRKLSTNAKLPYLLQRAQTEHKLLILTYLTDDVSEKIFTYLEDFLPNQIAHINGQTPKAKRQRYLDSFRSPNGVRVLVGTTGTVGTGLTLFNPSGKETTNEIIVADLPYTWAEFDKGISRLYREGQQRRVYVDVLQASTVTLRDGSAVHLLTNASGNLLKTNVIFRI
jgi:hypothetical protein